MQWKNPLLINDEKCICCHGNKNSGRWRRGSGKYYNPDGTLTPLGKLRYRKGRKSKAIQSGGRFSPEFEDYINSEDFVKGFYSKNNKVSLPETTRKKYSSPSLKKETIDEYIERKNKQRGKNVETPDVIYAKGKKKYESPDADASKFSKRKKKSYEPPDLDYDVSKATKKLKDENEFYEALKRNKELKMPKKDPKDYAKASGNFKGAASGIKAVSSGVGSAWESLHQMKYANKDRSKKVKDLSNAELRQVIERIKLDQEYNKLTMPPKSKDYDRTMAALSALESSMNIASTGMSFIAGIQNLKRKYVD